MAAALMIFDLGEVYDNSDHETRLVLRVSRGEVVEVVQPVPVWVREALPGSPLAEQLE